MSREEYRAWVMAPASRAEIYAVTATIATALSAIAVTLQASINGDADLTVERYTTMVARLERLKQLLPPEGVITLESDQGDEHA